MGTVNVTLGEDTRLNLILGQQLENAVTSVVFDFSAWQTAYGSGTLALSVQRPGDDQPYAVTMTTSGTDATWNVSNLDTAYKGVGHIQLTYTVGSAIKKSVIYKFTVYESLGANGEYPSPGQTWQEEIEDELADVKQDFTQLESDLRALEQEGYPMASITEAVNAWAEENEDSIVNNYVTPEMFGAKGDGITDDSLAVQQAFATGKNVLFSNKTYLFSGVTINNSVVVFGDNAVLIPVTNGSNSNRFNTMFTASVADKNITFKNLSFKWKKADYDTSLQVPLIKISNANKLTIHGCRFTDIYYYGATNPSDMESSEGAILTANDVNHTIIEKSVVESCSGDEIFWIKPSTKDRDEINISVLENTFINNRITVVDFIGNKAIVRDNTYTFENDMTSISGINLFGLDVNVQGDTWYGTIGNAYDNCESGLFEGDYFYADNITFNNTMQNSYHTGCAFNLKCAESVLSNIKCTDVDRFVRRIFATAGASGTHKDQSTESLLNSDMAIYNSNIQYRYYFLESQRGFSGGIKNITVENTIIKPLDLTLVSSVLFATYERYLFNGCTLSVQQVASGSYAVFGFDNNVPSKLIVSNCLIIPYSSNFALISGNINASIIGNTIFGATSVYAIGNSGTTVAYGNNGYIDERSITVNPTTDATAFITVPTDFKRGILFIKTSGDATFTMPISRQMLTSGYVHFRTGYANGTNNIIDVTYASSTNRLTLMNAVVGGTDYNKTESTVFTLYYE